MKATRAFRVPLLLIIVVSLLLALAVTTSMRDSGDRRAIQTQLTKGKPETPPGHGGEKPCPPAGAYGNPGNGPDRCRD